jgi:FixJ family two-component response regulator
MDDFITKPVEAAELARVVAQTPGRTDKAG